MKTSPRFRWIEKAVLAKFGRLAVIALAVIALCVSSLTQRARAQYPVRPTYDRAPPQTTPDAPRGNYTFGENRNASGSQLQGARGTLTRSSVVQSNHVTPSPSGMAVDSVVPASPTNHPARLVGHYYESSQPAINDGIGTRSGPIPTSPMASPLVSTPGPADPRLSVSTPAVEGARIGTLALGSEDNRVMDSRYSAMMMQSARQSSESSRLIAESGLAVISKFASDNSGFATQWIDLAERYNQVAAQLARAKNVLRDTTRDYEDVTAKLNQFGLTSTTGLLLRHKMDQLDRWQVEDSQIVVTSHELQRSRQELLQLDLLPFVGPDTDNLARQALAQAGYEPSLTENANLLLQVQQLLLQRSQWLTALRLGHQDYQSRLGEIDAAHNASMKLAREYRQLIHRHITWIRSGEPISLSDFRNLRGGFAALFDSRRSEDFAPTMRQKLKANPASAMVLLCMMIGILVARWRAKSYLLGIGNRSRMRGTSAKTRKVVAGVLTVLVSLGIPSMLFLLGRWFASGVVSESTLHAASGLMAASLVALFFEVTRQILRPSGYLDKHVDVELEGLSRACKFLILLSVCLVIGAYAITVMGAIDHGMWRDSIGRLGFMLAMLSMIGLAHRWLRPKGGFLEPLIAKFGGSVIHRIRFLIYALGIGFPIVMMILSALGYGFTANEFIKRAILTLVGLMAAATLWGGIKIVSTYAWQLLTGTTPPRKFDEYGEIEQKIEEGTGLLGEHFLELKHQLAFLCQCALAIGGVLLIGWLWIDMFPNLRMGNPVVWNIQENVTESTTNTAGQTVLVNVVRENPVTLLHLALAGATLFVAFQVAKLLPALFDALVLQRVSFDEGMEHFSLVLGRFLLFGVGCLIAGRLLGLRWQTIQWLAVGLTIGLGIGLQDMVRNLFGGFIVLFEKPARLGDLITVGSVTGRVASQKLRTTVISDDDGREVIVPNKKFVSDDVINWMGAGRLCSVPVEVAVKRDERPADVCRELQQLVAQQPDVLLTPTPHATLVCVGQRSQRIEVRAWIENTQHAKMFQDKMLRLVREHLRQKKLLSDQQPSQPAFDERGDSVLSSDTTRLRRRRKRA